MVKIRLSKIGRKKAPFYRIVAVDEAKKNVGRALETLGYWYPSKGNLEIKKQEIKAWIAKGAQISPSVQKLIAKK
ncbi:MAG: 30S ribosomal protein S16 [Patescibacteria group bacterium]|mgnify:CR=1 FL=1